MFRMWSFYCFPRLSSNIFKSYVFLEFIEAKLMPIFPNFTRASLFIKFKQFGRQKGIMVTGVPCVQIRNWGRKWDVLLYSVILNDGICRIQCLGVNFGNESRLMRLSHIQRCPIGFWIRQPWVILLENPPNKQSSSSFLPEEKSDVWVQLCKH